MSPSDVTLNEEHLTSVLASQRFLRMEGLGNEVPFFIYPYEPEDATAVAQSKRRITNKLSTQGISVLEIDLYELAIKMLQDRGVWEQLLDIEPTQTKGDFRGLLQGMLDPEEHLAPAIAATISESDFDILFLTGIGEVFPFIRSHNILNNLQSVVTNRPMLMFFPGRYEQSETLGSSLVLFGRLKDDQYYRAKNILEIQG